ncbi:YggS family pyridoxal phosphate-dependent enzyme [Anthropogastromicrobium aceti]|uniref:YggS family pyridoxal phosphate-dependent enzyme n=1 Tax=Anthropogastromicrobium aceti TaxID=2981768 RepID=UPI0008202C84|nr:YggS family pyridoxal phosphate-dependent enzyme [Anthropogastromicrobium aceti]MCU6782407.1 YggS family pyridoxal phosphate-dependent enzyme [Anthropogastromicrobium aceti]SCI83051.1 Predicted enzyme with a TIM-barrel fold [uncultured Lachnospira sp.]
MVSENLEQVKANIEAACKRVGRDPKDVRLVAVSKTKPISLIEEAIKAGQDTFGENKVQEMCDKMEVLPDNIKWHMIGHLQRNKVKYIAGKVELIHSVDSIRLAKQISDEAQKQSIEIPVLLEVNVAREESKFGFFTEETEDACREISKMPGIRVKGLMTSAPFVENAEDNRKYFKKLYELAVDIQSKNIDNISMRELSMGMTGDYVVAVEEGATIVRVGTGIFGSR